MHGDAEYFFGVVDVAVLKAHRTHAHGRFGGEVRIGESGGFDVVYFRESVGGQVTKGYKKGLHGAAGLMVSLNKLASGGLGEDYRINDMFFIFEARYRWVNDFGGGGVDLSGWSPTGGVHIQF